MLTAKKIMVYKITFEKNFRTDSRTCMYSKLTVQTRSAILAAQAFLSCRTAAGLPQL